MARKDKPEIHGPDHANGVDPIPGLTDQSLILYSSKDVMGDTPALTVPAYAGFGGSLNISYLHALEPGDSSWYELHYGGPAAVAPPYDSVVLEPGRYHVSAWTKFLDPGISAWLGAQLVLATTNATDFTGTFPYAAARLVDDTLAAGDIAGSEYASQFFHHAPLLVETGETGQVFVEIFHRDNHTIAADQNWSLQIIRLP